MADKKNNDNDYRCEVCNQSFTRKSSLDRHLIGKKHQEKVGNQQEKKEVEKKHRCEVCNYETGRIDLLKKHNKTETHKALVKRKEEREKFNREKKEQEAKKQAEEEKEQAINRRIQELGVEERKRVEPLPESVQRAQAEALSKSLIPKPKIPTPLGRARQDFPIVCNICGTKYTCPNCLNKHLYGIPIIPVVPTQPTVQEKKKQETKLEEAQRAVEFRLKERIRQQKFRDKKYEEEGRIQKHYDKVFIEGETKEERAKRLKKIRQQKWLERKKQGLL